MADQNVQDTNPKFLPLKKIVMAEKPLVGSNRAPEAESESDSNDISDDGEDSDAQKLEKLKNEAFYSLLLAFAAENSTLSRRDTSIVERLMHEFNITPETQIAFVDHIQKNLLGQEQQQRVISPASCEQEVQIIEEDCPFTRSGKKTTSSLNSAAKSGSSLNSATKSGSSLASVNPETLVGKCVRVRMPGKDEFEEFIIKEYDSKQDIHRLEPADPDAMEMDDVLSWIDIRRIPHRDIVWERGLTPKFDAPNQCSSTRGAHF